MIDVVVTLRLIRGAGVVLALLFVLLSAARVAATPAAVHGASSVLPSHAHRAITTTAPCRRLTHGWVRVVLRPPVLRRLQESTYAGHATAFLDPVIAALDFLRRAPSQPVYLYSKVDTCIEAFSSFTPNTRGFPAYHIVRFTAHRQVLAMHLIQPLVRGTGGIWVVDRYRVQASATSLPTGGGTRHQSKIE